MLRIRLLTDARRELADAAAYYRRESGQQLAREFRDEIRRLVMFAQRFPKAGPVVAIAEGLELRQFVADRFPYTVIACAVDAELVVFAIAAHKRDPDYWKPRLAKVRP